MYPPLVPFKKPEKTQKPITKDECYKAVTLKIDPSDEAKDSPTASIDKKIRLFADGVAEDWLAMLAAIWNGKTSYVTNAPLKTGSQCITMALTLLKGHAKELFQEALKFRRIMDESTKKYNHTDTTIFTLALNDTGRHFFPPERAYQRQQDYMLRYLVVKLDSSTTQMVREFTACLRELNSYLPYFPVKATDQPALITGQTEQHPQPCKTSSMASGDANGEH